MSLTEQFDAATDRRNAAFVAVDTLLELIATFPRGKAPKWLLIKASKLEAAYQEAAAVHDNLAAAVWG